MATGEGASAESRGQRIVFLASVIVILPSMLVVLQVLATRTDLKFLLFPPLAALGYRMFRQPYSNATYWRSVVAAPALGSALGFALSSAGGLTAWTTAVAALGGIAIIEGLRAEAPPTLAIILLALFVHVTWRFPVSVLASTVCLSLIFRAWRWCVERLGVW
jgi:RsiW-degrading membrane proteinase PrsW (M82 family)